MTKAPSKPFSQLYADHFDFVWRNARRLGVTEASTDDVVQDVFLVVHRRMSDFDGRSTWRAWIFGILIRVVRDHRRSFRRKGARCVPLSEEDWHADGQLSQGPSPLELAERAQRVRLLDHLLDQLDDDKRTLLVLSEFEQWTLREIAELMDTNTNTVYSRLRSAKRAFERAHERWRASGGQAP